MTKVPLSLFIEKNGFIFISGQVCLTENGTLLEGSVADKAHQIMENLKNVLLSADASFQDVVKTTIYVTDMSSYDEINKVYASYFKDSFPTREVVGVKELPLGAKIEISMIATK